MYGEKLKNIRKKHGLTQDQMESLTGVSQSTISVYETAAYPDLEYIVKVCKHHGIPLWEFFDADREIEKKFNLPNELMGVCQRIQKLSHDKQAKFLLRADPREVPARGGPLRRG